MYFLVDFENVRSSGLWCVDYIDSDYNHKNKLHGGKKLWQ